MCKNKNFQTMQGRLIGALIGLARATEGNASRPTEETDRIFIKGMQLCFPGQPESLQQILDQIEALHEEKQKLVPRCMECASPCGRNNDFDIIELNSSVRNSKLKYVLLSGLLFMASCLENSEKSFIISPEIMELFYKAFFMIGYDCEKGDLLLLFEELGEWQNKLYFQRNELKPFKKE